MFTLPALRRRHALLADRDDRIVGQYYYETGRSADTIPIGVAVFANGFLSIRTFAALEKPTSSRADIAAFVGKF